MEGWDDGTSFLKKLVDLPVGQKDKGSNKTVYPRGALIERVRLVFFSGSQRPLLIASERLSRQIVGPKEFGSA